MLLVHYVRHWSALSYSADHRQTRRRRSAEAQNRIRHRQTPRRARGKFGVNAPAHIQDPSPRPPPETTSHIVLRSSAASNSSIFFPTRTSPSPPGTGALPRAPLPGFIGRSPIVPPHRSGSMGEGVWISWTGLTRLVRSPLSAVCSPG